MKKIDDIFVLKKFGCIFILCALAGSCTLPVSQNMAIYHGPYLQLKLRFIGTTSSNLGPAFIQVVKPGDWDSPGNYYPYRIHYTWQHQGENKFVNFYEPTGRPEGFTHNNARDCLVPYHILPEMVVAYNGKVTQHPIYFALLGKGSNIFPGLANYEFGRQWGYFNIPAGINPEKEIAVFTIYGEYVNSIADFRVRTEFEGTELL